MRQALKLAFLAPNIVTSILAGEATFELADLRNVSALSWQSQQEELHQTRSLWARDQADRRVYPG
jgi:hypothetical protein